MKPHTFSCTLVACVFSASANADAPRSLTAAERAAGWTSLVDDAATKWRGYRQTAFPASGWGVEDGVLHVTSEASQDIVTVDQFSDFELMLEWKVAPGANSGIMYRVTETLETAWMTGPEYQILDDAAQSTAATDPHSAGAVYDVAAPPQWKKLKPVGEFNQARIRLKDNHLEHWLNDVKVADIEFAGDIWKEKVAASKFKDVAGFGAQPKGHIALQAHGGEVWFRNIMVRDLSKPMPREKVLFDGKTTNGWSFKLEDDKADPAKTWQVKDGALVCSGAPAGYIRTVDDYTNFVLKLEWRFSPVTRKPGNSGVLFRMVGEDRVWPKSVEAQLLSENAGDILAVSEFPMTLDPARSSGRHAKKVRGAERAIGEWNEYEIIMDHGDLTLKVNGDTLNRATNVEEVPGKVCLQSEGVEIQFRNVRLAPID